MYNSTTHEYGVDMQSEVEGLEITGDFRRDDWRAWAEEAVSRSKDHDIVALQEQIEDGSFPRYGYTTMQVFETVEEYEGFKLEQIEEDYAGEVERLLDFIEKMYSDNTVVEDEPAQYEITPATTGIGGGGETRFEYVVTMKEDCVWHDISWTMWQPRVDYVLKAADWNEQVTLLMSDGQGEWYLYQGDLPHYKNHIILVASNKDERWVKLYSSVALSAKALLS